MAFLAPGGFGDRGVQRKLLAAKYTREKKVPNNVLGYAWHGDLWRQMQRCGIATL